MMSCNPLYLFTGPGDKLDFFLFYIFFLSLSQYPFNEEKKYLLLFLFPHCNDILQTFPYKPEHLWTMKGLIVVSYTGQPLFTHQDLRWLLLLCVWTARAKEWSCPLCRWNGSGHDRCHSVSPSHTNRNALINLLRII